MPRALPSSCSQPSMQHRLTLTATCLVAITLTTTARAEDPGEPSWDDPADAYCEWVDGVAVSRQALLVAPELFGATGPAAAGSEETGDEFQSYPGLGWRVTAGIQYRLANLGRGMLTRKEADARCTEYRAQQRLRSVLVAGSDVGRLPAVRAQLNVIDDSLPRGERLVDLLEQGLALNLATVDELYSARLKVDGLRRQAGSLRQEIARLERLPSVADVSLDALLADHGAADDALERSQARLRHAASWSVDVRGGYDQLLTSPRDLPVFAQIRVGYNLGGLAQPRADRRAAEGRKVWREGASEATGARVRELREQLIGLRAAERERLDDVQPLVVDVEAQLLALGAIDTDRSEKVRESLWLDFVKLDAERAYILAHLDAIEGMIGGTAAVDDEADRPPAGDPTRGAIDRGELHVTLGRVAARDDRLFTDAGKMRAVRETVGDRGAELRFSFLGDSREQTALASGAVRKQLGVKLRAADSCNVVYVMWRIEPESQLVVSVKYNPGQTEHEQCHNDGYSNLAVVDVPPIAAGEDHVLRAEEADGALRVWADETLLWEGPLGDAATSFDGPIGIRTDNVALAFSLSPSP
jgi:hypothetical protein